MVLNIKKFFQRWRENVDIIKYDRWCEHMNEQLIEDSYAQENNMDSIHWCWNCKYSNCEKH